jgi:hypothetical protein
VQFLNYTLNSNAVSFVPPADSVKATTYVSNNQITITAARKNPNNNNTVLLSFNIPTGTGTVPVSYIYIYENQKSYVQAATLNLNITEFGAVGTGYMSGNLSGNMKDSSNNAILPASLSFRVKR